MSSCSYGNMQYNYGGGNKSCGCNQGGNAGNTQTCPTQQCAKLPNTCGNVPQPPNLPEINNYTNTYDVQGTTQSGIVENYYENYYNRYNHYNVQEYNYVTDYVTDYNVYHIRSTQTIYKGCQYLGSETIRVDANGCPVPLPNPQPIPGPCPQPLPVCRPKCGC